ncbi:hypothetical protein DUNSADRAFT_14256 [Dunaliella salina]|uniref:Uncharacterized protein n=1 Tax=Dunaliella salina TaxID=3046 RepID=A0ABQ7G7M8_DUNSA|nr:hypothetical protein DUNSADRAFT_14256 [Dunaliella salina]|eukprot:KAF5830609.1 hypothetical protein DUNSADRAFT_14256 [Dunaliella salina]
MRAMDSISNSCCLPHQRPCVLASGCMRPPPLQTSLPHLNGRQAWCAPAPSPRFICSRGSNARSKHVRSARRSFIHQQEGPFYAASSCLPSNIPAALPSALPSTTPAHPHAPSHSLLTKRIKLCTTSQELAAVLDEYGAHFNNINVAAVLVQLAQLPPGPQPPPPRSSSATDAQAWDAYASYEALLQRVLQQVAGLVSSLGARQVANVMWAAARLGRRCPDGFHPMCASLLCLLLPQSQVMLPWCTPQELSSSLWAVAVSGVSPSDDWLESFLLAFETALPNQVREPRHIATVMWGLARLGVAPDATWLATLKARTQQLLPAFTPRDIAQTLAGYAGLGLGAESGALSRGAVANMQQQLLQGLQQSMGTGEETQRLRSSRSRVAAGQGATEGAASAGMPGTAAAAGAAKGAKGSSASQRLAQLRLRHQQRQQAAQQEAHAYQQQGARAQQLSLQQQQLARRGAWQGQLEGVPSASLLPQQQGQQQQQQLSVSAGSSGQRTSLNGSEQNVAMQGSDDVQLQQQQQQQQQHFLAQAPEAPEVAGVVGNVPVEADPAGLGPLESWAEQAVSSPLAQDGVGAQQGVQQGQAGNAPQQHGSNRTNSSSSSSDGGSISNGSGQRGSEEGAQALAMALWSLAVMGWVPPLAWMEETFALVLDNLPAFNPTSLSTALWAAITLGQRVPLNLMHAMYGATTAHLHAYPPRSLASLVWAVSVADQAHTSSSSSSALARPMQPPAQWAEALLFSVHSNLPAYCGQSMSLVLVALARLGITPPQSWATRVVGHLTGPLAPGIGPQALSNSMWALAKMGFSLNKEGSQAFLRLLCARLPSSTTFSQPPPSSTNTATDQATYYHASPAASLAGGVSTHTTTFTSQSQAAYPLNAQELTNVLYALARFGHAPSQDQMEGLLEALRLCLGGLPPSAASAEAAAVAQAPPQQSALQEEKSGAPAEGYTRLDSSSSSSSKRRSADRTLNTQELSNVLWALAKLGVQPSEVWMADFWAAVQQQIRSFNAKDLSQLVYALAKLGRIPPSHPTSPAPDAAPYQSLEATGTIPQGPHMLDPVQAPHSYTTPGSSPNSNILTLQGASTIHDTRPNSVVDTTAAAEAAQLSYPHLHHNGLHPGGISGVNRTQQRGQGEQHAWAHALLREAAATFPRCSGQDLANLGWGSLLLQSCSTACSQLRAWVGAYKKNNLIVCPACFAALVWHFHTRGRLTLLGETVLG